MEKGALKQYVYYDTIVIKKNCVYLYSQDKYINNIQIFALILDGTVIGAFLKKVI